MTTQTGRTITVRCDLPPAVLSPNARPNRYVKARALANYRFSCWADTRCWWFFHGNPMQRATVTLRFVFCGGRMRDPDNLAASFKAGLDGIVDAGVLVDDSAKVIVSTTVMAERCRHEHEPGWGRSYVEATITEVQA